jgi:murein DD-endopeptidase MepM/ murein hydrolase activator NlpD
MVIKMHKSQLDKQQRGKKNILRKGFFGILITLLVIMVINPFRILSFANEIDKAKDEKSNLQRKKEETEAKIKALEKDKNDILKYIEKLDMELNTLANEIEALNKDIEQVNKDIEIAQVELEAARIAEANQYNTMKKRIKYMYENGNATYFDVILQSDNLAELLNHVEYISKITEYDNNLLDEYTRLKQDVIDKEAALQKKHDDLETLKAELAYEKETVEKLSVDKNKELKKYEETIKENQLLSEEYSNKIEEQEEHIEQLLEEARRRKEEEERRKREEEERRRKEEEERRKQENGESGSTSGSDSGSTSGSSSGTVSGNFIWPVPASGRITSTFGNRESPTAGASTYHKGIDIGAPSGSSIKAAMSGEVVTATYSVSAGNYIMLYHGDGVYTVYMHCSKLLVSVGDYVNQGDTIALVGNTGYSTGPHLHFGIVKDGSYVNPLNYVSY